MTGVLLLAVLGAALLGCLLTARRYRRARYADICNTAARDGVLACYAIICDGRRYDPGRNPELARLDGSAPISPTGRRRQPATSPSPVPVPVRRTRNPDTRISWRSW